MTDVHCHISANDPAIREFLIGRDFVGVHPWETLTLQPAELAHRLAECSDRLAADPRLGAGEIGLDRLKTRDVTPMMEVAFLSQLVWAVRQGLPVVLHGAKCWGQVFETVRKTVAEEGNAQKPARFLYHGFSRSEGLIDELVALNGYISVGPAILNDHASNYRELATKIPAERLLVETDRTSESEPNLSVRDVLAKLAEIRGVSADELERLTDANAERFWKGTDR